MSKVFLTGLGFITSIGNDTPSVADNLRHLRHGVVKYPPFADEKIPVKVAAPVKGFDTESLDPEDWTYPSRYRVRREILRSMGPHGLYSYCAMLQAIEDAGLAPEDISNPNTGLFGASAGSPNLLTHYVRKMHEQGVMRCSPLGIVASISGTVQFNLVAHFKIQGASTGFASACASSSHAAGYAYDEIMLGRQDRMFVVGAEDGNVETILPFAGMRALSLNPDPNTASRPFDRGRDGFVGTGGATVLVLESEAEVARRGVVPYCEVAGWGQASDGHNVAISHPEGTGLARALERALKCAKADPTSVDYINAHATSTPIGDISEGKAIRTVFNPSGARPGISSTKALTGHGLSLAGAMETGFCAVAMREGFTPGSAHITAVDPALADLNILRETVDERPKIVINNSSGFGGANVALVLRAVPSAN
ncbi:beta-ketoacyl-[acyl-carrier-protein] synthase family protein [Synoicihabitans lomoniglobus]|uniref:3-oxoacyl-[acyl-carrier-protein] synthase 1 n=1 Tax=Synoicihabitans lomoniglobus TaxID=2909285 RepID=A0AAF0I5L7_9BACT|nr:beta-ketoacyl-[acyl-carrier-protein] synthase family protein [Opitutaceae bacterium LMO-M01]WED67423.1 beta-ketoacyl-[acyl-carrier-protein] synthase family protein [Opitutaceae bacterium LMO-M01]